MDGFIRTLVNKDITSNDIQIWSSFSVTLFNLLSIVYYFYESINVSGVLSFVILLK